MLSDVNSYHMISNCKGVCDLEQNNTIRLDALMRLVGQLRQVSRRGVRTALSRAPKCRFGMLERLHHTIQAHGEQDAIYVSELARAVKQPLPAISRGLRLLEQDDMVQRTTDPADRRKTLVRLTPEGEQTLQACEKELNAYFARVMARIEPEKLAQMLELQQLLIDALEAETEAMAGTADAKEETAYGEDL